MHAYLWPHLLDLLRYFFGDPVEVTAALVDDQALRPPVRADRAGVLGVSTPASKAPPGNPTMAGSFSRSCCLTLGCGGGDVPVRDPELLQRCRGRR